MYTWSCLSDRRICLAFRCAGENTDEQDAAEIEVERLKTVMAEKRSFGVQPTPDEVQALMNAQLKAAGLPAADDELGMPPAMDSPKLSAAAGVTLAPGEAEAAVARQSAAAALVEPEPEPEPESGSAGGKFEGKHLFGSVNDVVLLAPTVLASCGDDKTIHLCKHTHIPHRTLDSQGRVLTDCLWLQGI